MDNVEKSRSPDAIGTDDVCAMQGRIVRSGGRVQAVFCPAMGVSRYVARIMLAAMHRDAGLRTAMNIRYSGPCAGGYQGYEAVCRNCKDNG